MLFAPRTYVHKKVPFKPNVQSDALHLPLNPERLRKLTEDYVSSNAKIKKALGVERMPVDARKGLQRTLESFK